MGDGAFDALPGRGKPLALEDDRLVPEEARVGYRILENAGVVPPELALHREIADLARLQIADLARLLTTLTSENERGRAHARLAMLQAEFAARGRGAAARRRLPRTPDRALGGAGLIEHRRVVTSRVPAGCH
ncbi:MAG: DnaJ family domain-containing protein [Casimicrobiaceae bacterium]